MDDIVKNEYEKLYKDSRDPYELKPWIDQLASELKGQTGRTLRPDAGYLLLLNFSAVVIQPAELAQRVPVVAFRQDVRNDIRLVVQEAARISNEMEISGHQVINALPSVWAKMKTMAYNVWD